LLDVLIATSQEGFLSDLDMRDEVNTFIIAVCISKLSSFLYWMYYLDAYR